jgi:hypothetical protein
VDDDGDVRRKTTAEMNLHEITPVIAVYNEGPNLRRCLARLKWASQVVVVDSGSTDETLVIAAEFPNVRVVQHEYVDHTSKWNFGISESPTRWILSLDADYVLCAGFEDELRTLDDAAADAWFAHFHYCVNGFALRATLYPPRAVLFRKDHCTYIQDGHTQLLVIPGPSRVLRTALLHDDRKPLSRWFVSQDHCARLEAVKLMAATPASMRWQDRARKLLIAAPILTFFYCLFAKGLILDGWRGWFYTWQRVLAEVMLSLRLLEVKCPPRD